MVRDELSVLSAFLAVAEERSCTRAAKRLGVSTSALSHAMRGLEERFGVHLLARTTRSVAPTHAGEQLIARLRPALGDIRGALDLITGLRDRPAGRVRLLVSPIAATTVLAPKLGQFARDYPDVVLDVTTDESRVDLVAAGFDAGIHFGGPRRAAPREWGTRARARRLVSAVPGLLPLLPPATAAISGTRGAHRNPASVTVSSFCRGSPRPPDFSGKSRGVSGDPGLVTKPLRNSRKPQTTARSASLSVT